MRRARDDGGGNFSGAVALVLPGSAAPLGCAQAHGGAAQAMAALKAAAHIKRPARKDIRIKAKTFQKGGVLLGTLHDVRAVSDAPVVCAHP
jgi:nickel-dependent lactate racemase